MSEGRVAGNLRRQQLFGGPTGLAGFRDHASLRRYLVDAGILARDHGVYRRA